MTNVTDYPWTIGALTIGTYAYGLETLAGVHGRPDRRHTPRIIPGLPGEVARYDDPLEVKTTRLRLYVTGTDADGNVTHTEGPIGHYNDNIDALLAELDNTDLITVTREVPDPSGTNRTRTAAVYATRSGINRSGPASGQLDVTLHHPYPYWLDSVLNSDTVTSGTFATLSPAPATNLWIYNADFSFAAASRLTHEDTVDGVTDAWIEITGSPAGGYPVVVNPKAGTVIDNGGNDAQGLLTFSHNFWMRFRSGNARFRRSAGNVTISWYDHHP